MELKLPKSKNIKVTMKEDVEWIHYEKVVENPQNVKELAKLKKFAKHWIQSIEVDGIKMELNSVSKFLDEMPAEDVFFILSTIQIDIFEVQKVLEDPGLKARANKLQEKSETTEEIKD
jgi:hypothetical protein